MIKYKISIFRIIFNHIKTIRIISYAYNRIYDLIQPNTIKNKLFCQHICQYYLIMVIISTFRIIFNHIKTLYIICSTDSIIYDLMQLNTINNKLFCQHNLLWND